VKLNLSYIIFSLFLISAIGCTGSKNVLLEGGAYSEELQRNYFQGAQHLLKGDQEAAYASFLRCSDEEPNVASFHYDLARIDSDLDRHESALVHFDRAVDLDPENDWYRYYRAIALVITGNYDEATDDFKIWIKARPGDLEALRECSDIFISASQPWHAYQLLTFYEAEIAKNVDVRLDMFTIISHSLISISNIEFESLEVFVNRSALEFPNEPTFALHRGLLAAFNKDYDSSILILEKLRFDHPYYMKSVIPLAESYTAVGRTQEAFDLLLIAFKSEDINLREKSDILLGYLEFASAGSEIMAKFDQLLKVALETHSGNPDLLHFAALHWLNIEQFGKAREALAVVVTEDPGSLEGHIDYLGVLFHLKDWEYVVKAGAEASLAFPLESIIYLYSGGGYKQLKEYEKAIKQFKNGLSVLIDLPKTGASLYSELAECFRELNQKEKSYEAFEKSLSMDSSPYVMNNHAYFLASDNKRIQDALKWSTLANEMVKDEPNFMDTHALILHLLVRNSDALEWIVKAQSLLDSPDAVFLEREGDIRWALGETKKAYNLWEDAIIAGGGKKRLNEKLSRTP
jgi:tetratricopeptide (TPR) repeat protein